MTANAMAPPMERKKVSAAVAWPILFGMAFCTIRVYSDIPKSMPRPNTSTASKTAVLGEWTSRRNSSNVPQTLMSIQVMASHLYLPRRETSCPETILPTTRVSVKGVRTRPLLVADEPTTPCTYKGMKKMAPNNPMPKMKVTSVETAKMLFLNRLGTGHLHLWHGVIRCHFLHS